MKNKNLFKIGLFALLALNITACSDSDSDITTTTPTTTNDGAFFVSVTGESAEYLLNLDSINSGSYSISDNVEELEQSGYTWIFNDNPSTAIGLIYQQGDPGIGLGVQLTSDGELSEEGQFQITSRFTSYGFFNDYALTTVGGQTPVDSDGNALTDDEGNERTDGVTFNFIDINNDFGLSDQTITTLGITGTTDQATFSGIVDMGDGTFLTGVVASQAKDASAGGGASSGTITYPDSVWVARLDADLNIEQIYRDDRISYSSGRYRSQYYSQIGEDDDNNVYVFSGSYESTTTLPCGALRINNGEDDFDQDYYFNIEDQSDGLRFRKVWHITEDYFLLEFYNMTFDEADEEGESKSSLAATQYAVVKMEDKTLTWVSGLPDKDSIVNTGLPMAYDGKMYFPVTAENEDPTIYIIDPETATATAGVTISGASEINAVGHLSVN